MSTLDSTDHRADETTVPKTTLPSYMDAAFGVRVHLVDTSRREFNGKVGALIDDTTDRDGLFVSISHTLPVDRRAAVVRALVVSWARQFDAVRAEGGTVVSAVSA